MNNQEQVGKVVFSGENELRYELQQMMADLRAADAEIERLKKQLKMKHTPETDAYERAMAEDDNYFGEDSTREAYEFARKLERRLNWLLAFHNSTATARIAGREGLCIE